MVDLTLISVFVSSISDWFSLEMVVLVHPHSEILCGASLPFFSFSLCNFRENTCLFHDSSMIFCNITLNFYQLEEPSIKPASWTL